MQVRIFALAAGATLSQAAFIDFWTRAATRWKNHPGFGGYGLMNEPYDMPAPGTTVEPYDVQMQDLHDLADLRAGGDQSDPRRRSEQPDLPGRQRLERVPRSIANNPGWPLQASQPHLRSAYVPGCVQQRPRFDYDTEVAKNFSAGFGPVPINVNTGVDRLKIATDWAQAHGVKLALTETGMPIDDPRWQDMFQNMVNYARAAKVRGLQLEWRQPLAAAQRRDQPRAGLAPEQDAGAVDVRTDEGRLRAFAKPRCSTTARAGRRRARRSRSPSMRAATWPRRSTLTVSVQQRRHLEQDRRSPSPPAPTARTPSPSPRHPTRGHAHLQQRRSWRRRRRARSIR